MRELKVDLGELELAPRLRFNSKTALAWLVLLPASGGAAYEAVAQAEVDNARAALGWFFVSGAILGGCIGYTRGNSIFKSALWGLLIWPTIGCALAIIAILVSGTLVVTAY